MLDPDVAAACKRCDVQAMMKIMANTTASEGMAIPVTEENARCTIHKIRVNSQGMFPKKLVRESRQWLAENGYSETIGGYDTRRIPSAGRLQ